MVDPVERLTDEWQLSPAAARSDLPYTGMAVVHWSCRGVPRREFVSRVGDDTYAFSFLLRPMRAMVRLDGRQVWTGAIPAHGIRILPPAAEPRWIGQSGFNSLQCHVPVHALDEIAGSGGRIELKDPLYATDAEAAPLAHAIVAALRDQDRLAGCYIDGLAIALLSRLVSRFGNESDSKARIDARLRRAIDFVEAHLGKDVRVADVARVAGLSPYHFSHLFSAAIGMPPHRYILARRIERAKQRLLFGREPILAIALACGFKDASHFARVFARETGAPPRRFRQMA